MTIAEALIFPELRKAQDREFLEEVWRRSALPRHLSISDSTPSGPFGGSFKVSVPQQFPEFLNAMISPEIALIKSSVQAVAKGNSRTVLENVYGELAREVSDLAARSLARLMHLRREAGELPGADPHERYRAFDRSIAHDQTLIQRHFPYLLPTVRHRLRKRREFIEGVMRSALADRSQLGALGIAAGDVLVGARLGGGDSHRGGQSVVVLTFTSGVDVIYKPRTMAIDLAFQSLVRRVGAWTETPLPTLQVIDRGSYGWMESCDQQVPTTEQGRAAYFRALGVLGGLLHALGARDIHHRNVMAHRGMPVVIDLETIIHPPVAQDRLHAAADAAEVVLDDSVCSIGILPTVVVNGDRGSVEVGGLAGDQEQLSPFRSLVAVNRDRDDLRYELRSMPLRPASGVLLRAETDETYVAADGFDAGFVDAYRSIQDHPEDILAELPTDSWVRHIHNATSFYAQILRLLTHPVFYADGDARLRAAGRVGIRRREDTPDVVAHEVRELLDGDVPYFSARLDRATLTCGSQDVPDQLLCSPLQWVQSRLNRMGEWDLFRQRQLIRHSFVGKFPSSSHLSTTSLARRSATPSRGQIVELVEQIADRLTADQLGGRTPSDPATWLGPVIGTRREDMAWYPGVLGSEVYAGGTGIALFLAHASRLTGRSRYRRAAAQVVEPLVERLVTGPLAAPGAGASIGMYGGLGGLFVVAAHAAQAIARPDLAEESCRAADRLVDLVRHDSAHDFVAGSVGLLAGTGALARLAGPAGRQSISRVRRALVEHVLTADLADSNLTRYSGFGHGAAALRPALADVPRWWPTLADRTERVLVEADERLDSLRTADGWWTTPDRDRVSHAWCHGAPGIGLSAALVQSQGGAPLASAEERMRLAAEDIRHHGIGNNLTYCHGDLGNVEILTRLGVALDEPALTRTAHDLASQLVREVIPRHLTSTRQRYAQTSSLMVGTAGMGYFLLRLLDPEGTVSVLTWD